LIIFTNNGLRYNLQYILIKLEFVDKVTFSDEFDDICGFIFVEDFFDVVWKVESSASWFIDNGIFREYVLCYYHLFFYVLLF
jgi:hypothetical protein